MFRIPLGSTRRYCDGQSRRHFLQIGLAGMGSIGLSHWLRLKEASAAATGVKKDTSVILLWLDGGPGHMDLYDMKPEAPPEYRGHLAADQDERLGDGNHRAVPAPGPRSPTSSRSSARSITTRATTSPAATGCSPAATRASAAARLRASFRSLARSRPRFSARAKPGMPANVAVPYAMSIGLRPGYFGGNYLGPQENPFETDGDPNNDKFQVQNLALSNQLTLDRLSNRRSLIAHFDHLRRETDRSGTLDAMDRFERQAFDMVTGEQARKAFDLSQEDPKLRERYGRHSWGQSTLLARRLVEAGTTFVTCHFGGWDHHWDLQKGYENYLPKIDQLVSALFTDLAERGLLDKTLVVLCGEFSRTPRMNDGGNGGAPMSMGTPGRDHWGNAMFCLLGGGGVKGGRIVGSTNRLGEAPQDRPVQPGDIHHTIFRVLGVDPHTAFPDNTGRPIAAIDHGEVISELF